MEIRTVLITGANGAIGQGLCQGFQEAGWRVIGTDYAKSCTFSIDDYISIDLDRLCKDNQYREKCINDIYDDCTDGLDALINFKFEDDKHEIFTKYLTSEMLKKGFLAKNSILH